MTLFDPGLQPERTELAWRRTGLALAVGSLIALRLLPVAFGSSWWALAGAAGLSVTGGLFLGARRRYRLVNENLARDGDHARMPSAGILLAVTLFLVAIGVVSLAIILVIAARGGG